MEQVPEFFFVVIGDLTVGKGNHYDEPTPTKAEFAIMVSLGFDRRPRRCIGERGIVEHTVVVELVHCMVLIAQLNGRAA